MHSSRPIPRKRSPRWWGVSWFRLPLRRGWGRQWLDLVRFAETGGHEFDFEIPGAYQYRDYVIRAFNADLPYDVFVREHLAGDLLTEPRRHPTHRFNESIIGTAFFWLVEGK